MNYIWRSGVQELRSLRGGKCNVIHNSWSSGGPIPFSRVGLSRFIVVLAASVEAGEARCNQVLAICEVGATNPKVLVFDDLRETRQSAIFLPPNFYMRRQLFWSVPRGPKPLMLLWFCTLLPAACTLPSKPPTKLTSHSGYHAQQCLTKTLACTSQLQPQWLKHTAVRRQAGCNLQELLIQGNTQGLGQRD